MIEWPKEYGLNMLSALAQVVPPWAVALRG